MVLIGLQGSGKTTFFKQRFAATHEHISKDTLPASGAKAARQRQLLEAAFAAGRSVVVDNTSPTVADRAAIISVARRHGARVTGYFFGVTTREAVARNRQREGRARVPDAAIFTTAKRLERPTLSEGFDELYRVTVKTGEGFTIEMQRS